ncbi:MULTISPECIES: hypothetical protein [Rhizobium]|uniref:Chorismate mutase n=1 Tax=Rhizobium paranaense TaxID=1650438 RepID=A0A7W8XNR4_9HYPH|nr:MULTISPECIES: hypothetical protein [Rhizobium]MBB5572783.1 chorismate mutase [Rhizobium paranaense]
MIDDHAQNEKIRAKIRQALEDGRPDVSAEDVFEELRTYHAEKLKLGDDVQSPS